MTEKSHLIIVTLFSLALLTSCGWSQETKVEGGPTNLSGGNGGGGNNPSGGEDSPYEQQALGILASNCSVCHGAMATGAGNNFNNILDVNSLVTRGYVVPGNPDGSPLIQSEESNSMPEGGPPLSAADKSTLRNWVAQKK